MNRTLPCTLSSVQIFHAEHTRRGFLERIFNPLLSANRDRPYTLAGLLQEVSTEVDKLNSFGMPHPLSSLLQESFTVKFSPTETCLQWKISSMSFVSKLDFQWNVI